MEYMAGESHYWPRRQCYRSACKLPVCVYAIMCVRVCVCVSLHAWSWMATPDSERNAGLTPVYQPSLAFSALKVIETKKRFVKAPHRFAHQPKSRVQNGGTWSTWAQTHETSLTTTEAWVKRSANRMVAALSFSPYPSQILRTAHVKLDICSSLASRGSAGFDS